MISSQFFYGAEILRRHFGIKRAKPAETIRSSAEENWAARHKTVARVRRVALGISLLAIRYSLAHQEDLFHAHRSGMTKVVIVRS
jgi:hypothetical protein